MTRRHSRTTFKHARKKTLSLRSLRRPGIDVSPELQMEGLIGRVPQWELRRLPSTRHIKPGNRFLHGRRSDSIRQSQLMPKLYNTLGNIYRKQERMLGIGHWRSVKGFKELLPAATWSSMALSARSYNRLDEQPRRILATPAVHPGRQW